MASLPPSVVRSTLVLLTFGLVLSPKPARAADQVVHGQTVAVTRSAAVNVAELARAEARARVLGVPPVRARVPAEELNEMDEEPGAGAIVPARPPAPFIKFPAQAFVASPSPTLSYQGLDDVPMADSSYIVIPPDVGGAVGPTKVMEGFNNNYRIRDKATGATQLTIGTATFWNPVVSNKALLNQLTDPRTVYDPIQGRWLVCMQTTNSTALILFGVSQTSDPAGSWFLYAVSPGFTSAPRLDYPILGYNKNWLVVTINAYTSGGAFSKGGTMIASYPDAAAGTLVSTTNISQAAGSHFCTAPCATISATEDTLFLVTHLSSAGGTYTVDRITGAVAPTYTTGGTNARPGGGWVQPSGQLLPQSAPNAGTSSCGATPCPIETQDAQVRSAPVFRLDSATGRQFIYYTQTVGLPATGLTHTAVQWTKITASTTPAFADGGRIEDPTATATNGGKWYAFAHIAVNSTGDFLVGYSQFSSAQHPSAGYSFHDHTDGLGTMRDPLVYKAGDDYYHKDFGGGRNRWGDFTTAQVDPSDDVALWVLQEYARPRTSTNDGTTGANGSKWSTYWASVVAAAPTFTITATPGANGSIAPSGAVVVNQGASQAFTITPDACYHVADVLVDGGSIGAVTNHTFNNVQANHTIDASFAIDTYTITASAGSGGSITPSGAVSVNCGADQAFTITPDAGFAVSDVVVDGGSIGAVTSHTFTNVTAAHTIAATFVDSDVPTVQALQPFGGTVLLQGTNAALTWTASDNVGVSAVDLLLSRTGSGGPFDPLATGIANSGSFDWTVTGPPTIDAFLKVIAYDAASHSAFDVSDTAFVITDNVAVEGEGPPADFALGRFSPHPVHGVAHIRFDVPRAATIHLSVFDMQGREVAVLADGPWEAGRHQLDWRSASAPPGLYFVRYATPGHSFVRKLVRVR